MARDNNKVFVTRSLSVMQQHLIVGSGKSEVELTIIKDSARGFTLLKLTTDGHSMTRPLCNSRATCLIGRVVHHNLLHLVLGHDKISTFKFHKLL